MTDATVKVFNEDSTATGFYVRPPPDVTLKKGQLVLVTAAHVFEKMSGNKAIVVFRKTAADGSYTRIDDEVKVRDGNTPLWTRHPSENIAVMAIDIPQETAITPIDFDQIADEPAIKAADLHIGVGVLFVGYPTRVDGGHAIISQPGRQLSPEDRSIRRAVGPPVSPKAAP